MQVASSGLACYLSSELLPSGLLALALCTAHRRCSAVASGWQLPQC